jgi:hypothetical protein
MEVEKGRKRNGVKSGRKRGRGRNGVEREGEGGNGGNFQRLRSFVTKLHGLILIDQCLLFFRAAIQSSSG